MKELINNIIDKPDVHARWLNTLSMMENVGARKIKKCEHPVFVSEIILKHASEEARHAYYLKRQIQKIGKDVCPTYEREYLIAPVSSYAYLDQLDIMVCRYLKKEYNLKAEKLKYAAYLLVTYAIEVRADELYPQYQSVLKQRNSPVSVRNIIEEEKDHLAQMELQLKELYPEWKDMCTHVCMLEEKLYNNWLEDVKGIVEEAGR